MALTCKSAGLAGQSQRSELVMQYGQRSEDPAVRAAAVLALGNLDDRLMIEAAQQVDPPPRAFEKRLTVEERAELLGAWIAGDGPRERSQPYTVATGEDQ